MPETARETTTAGRPDFQDLKDPGYELFIIGVSVLSVINLVLVYIPGLDPDAVNVIRVFNFFLTIIFLADFVFRLLSAQSKTHYFFRDWGWADLLASIPSLRILRIFRIFKAYRLMSRYGAKNIWDQLKKHRAESMLYIVLFCVMLVHRVRLRARPHGRAFGPEREHPDRIRCHVVGVRYDHDRGLWRPVPGDECGPDRWRARDDEWVWASLGPLPGISQTSCSHPKATIPRLPRRTGKRPGERGEEILARLDRIEAELKNRPR